eukprot:1144180-Pelagomonas_calceolata.AAC.4
MILKVVSKGYSGPNLVHMEVGSTDRLAHLQHDLHIPEQVPNREVPSYFFDPNIPDQARRNSSRPDAILVIPCPTNPNRPPNSPSHQVLRSMRGDKEVRTITTPVRLHELNILSRQIHLIGIKHCKDMRPGAQLEAAQQQ